MKKKDYRTTTTGEATIPAPPVPETVTLAMDGIASAMREGLMAMAVSAGLDVLEVLLDESVIALAGLKGRHDPSRVAVRHGGEDGSVVLGGRKIPVRRPGSAAPTGPPSWRCRLMSCSLRPTCSPR